MENILKYQNKFRIRSTRLSRFDYSSNGYYFVTICVKEKICCLGTVKNNKCELSELGIIVKKCWLEIPKHFPEIALDFYEIMPNHLHGILINNNNHDCRDGACPVSTLGNIVGSFKSASSNLIHKIDISFKWQSRFYDHVIRNEKSLSAIREYISLNPTKWGQDEENPDNK